LEEQKLTNRTSEKVRIARDDATYLTPSFLRYGFVSSNMVFGMQNLFNLFYGSNHHLIVELKSKTAHLSEIEEKRTNGSIFNRLD